MLVVVNMLCVPDNYKGFGTEAFRHGRERDSKVLFPKVV